MATLDIIMLANTVNDEIYRMTKNALRTLKESSGSENFIGILSFSFGRSGLKYFLEDCNINDLLS